MDDARTYDLELFLKFLEGKVPVALYLLRIILAVDGLMFNLLEARAMVNS